MTRTFITAVLALALDAHALEAAPAWSALTALKGTWVAKTAHGEVTVNFRLTSRNSVLVETYTAGTTETLTVFHHDGSALVATHYCAQDNQPRLKLVEKDSTATSVVFDFQDATNLKQPTDSHLVHLTLSWANPKQLVMTETYLEDGKPEASTLTFSKR